TTKPINTKSPIDPLVYSLALDLPWHWICRLLNNIEYFVIYPPLLR
ncbi:MAG: hypothetical protein ACI8Z5_002608, partial [Lentimonas sp.]